MVKADRNENVVESGRGSEGGMREPPCVLCEHWFRGNLCMRPRGYDPVTGGDRMPLVYARNERSGGKVLARLRGTCGKEGRFFTPREKRGAA